MKSPDISVITLSYNTLEITRTCLEKVSKSAQVLKETKKCEAEIIVVDNGSVDGSVEMIKEIFPRVKLILPGHNTGFGGGNNLGMKHCHGRLILLINSDIYLKPDTLVRVMEEERMHTHWDIWGCELRLADGTPQASGGYLPTPFRVMMWWAGISSLPLIGYIFKPIHPKWGRYFSKEKKVEWVMGAFMVLKKEIFIKTKGFDEKLFMYMEEVEWCMRIKKMGFNIWYSPNFWVTHLDKASSKFDIKKPLIHEVEGLMYFMHKHYPQSIDVIKLVLMFGCFWRWLLFNLVSNKTRCEAYTEAINKLTNIKY